MTAVDPHTDSWQPINLNTLADKPPVQPTLGFGLVYPGLRHVFSGPPESAKTLAAYLILIETAATDHCILIDFEMGAYNARDRLRDLGATPTHLERIHYLEPEAPASAGKLEQLLRAITPTLVVIDASAGAYDLQGLDDNSRRDVGHIYRLYVEPFFRAQVATIFLDHVVKNNETRGKFAIGSERKVGVADVHLGFETITPISRGHNGLYKIHTHKDRGGFHKRGILAELELASHPETHRITYELRPAQETDSDHPWMPTKVMQHVSEVLEKNNEPLSRTQTCLLVGGRKEIALQAIDHLIRHGYVTETTGARHAKLLQHHHTFTVHEWESKENQPTRSHPFPPVPGTGPPSPVPCTPLGVQAGNGSTPTETSPPVPDEQTAWSWIDELTPHPPNNPF